MVAKAQKTAADMDVSSRDLTAALPAVGRLLLATLFLLSGFAKVTSPASFLSYIASVGLPLPKVALSIAILVELVGGAMLVAGYKTRPVAYTMAAFTLATAFFFHSNLTDQTEFLFFFKNVAITGGLLQVAAFGAGGLSLDRR